MLRENGYHSTTIAYMNSIKQFIRGLVPEQILTFYHGWKASAAAAFFGYPANNMIVIGVTGTKGKSSVGNFVWAGLSGAGIQTGLLSTANIRIGGVEYLNPYHMTMLNPFVLQRFLRKMVRKGCKAVVVETTSEGILQSRHKGISYDIVVFTSLTPEHIEHHKTFERYRAAKQVIFSELMSQRRKKIRGQSIPKMIIANADSPEAENFLKFSADIKQTYGESPSADIRAENIIETITETRFSFGDRSISLPVLGRFNAINALPAFAIGRILKLNENLISRGLEDLKAIPGRMELVHKNPFVIVDYAHEPESLRAALTSVRALKNNGRLILVFGATGGGRDKRKRPIMGRFAAEYADVLIITNDDPFNEPPMDIINAVAGGVRDGGKTEGEHMFLIEDRRSAIKKAIEMAHADDVVLVAGKGAEQILYLKHKKVPWDDRRVVREIFK